MFQGKRILVTGGTGSMGKTFVHRVLSGELGTPKKVIVFSPLSSAGSARCEGLGIALIAEMRGDDPNALIGLPLIALTEMLAAQGVSVL